MTRSIPISMIALALCLGITMAPDLSTGASLELIGPPGTLISIDDEVIGTLPLAEAVNIRTGDYIIVASLPGAEPFVRNISVHRSNEQLTLHVRLSPMSRRSAVLSSLMIAGAGQRYEGHSKMGWGLTLAEVGGLAFALISDSQVQNHKNDYLLAQDVYNNAITQADIDAARVDMQAIFDDMDSAVSQRDAAMMVAVGAVVVSVIDAFVRFPALDTGFDLNTVGPFETTSASTTPDPGFHVALSWGF